ncbi:Zinc finger protein 24, partial [Calypte anna]
YKCLEHGKEFTRSSSLSEHHCIHAGEKLYPCTHCGKAFNNSTSWINHQHVHTGEKP